MDIETCDLRSVKVARLLRMRVGVNPTLCISVTLLLFGAMTSRSQELPGTAGRGDIANDGYAQAKDDLSIVVYPLQGLPTWRLDQGGIPQFDPSTVVAYIRTFTSDDNWGNAQSNVSIAESASLLVRQTPRVHARVSMALSCLREFAEHVQYRSAFDAAKKDNKRVLIQVGGPGCAPCIALSRFLESQPLLSKDYTLLKLDMRMSNIESVLRRLGRGSSTVPWMAIVSADGNPFITSDSRQGNIGFPQTDAAKSHFRSMLMSTRQRLTESEIETMTQMLLPEE